MARTGNFGRAPRSATSLTATLVAIAREYQNQRNQNIMDAWQKGGMFEGKKATDEVVLKFWKDRANGVSKDDPLYDTYHNAQTQLDYSIHESKMTAAYALSKKTPADDHKMVAFYLNWAKKVPKDSEFYRVLQRDAGQYMRAVRATSQADANRRKEEAYQKQQADTQKSKEAGSEYVIDTIRRIAQSGNPALGLGPAIAAPGSGSDLTQFDPNDPDLMLRLVAAITTEGQQGHKNQSGTGEFTGSTEVLFHDDDGKAVTGQSFLKTLAGMAPGIGQNTHFSVNSITDLMDRQMQGLNERIARAKATGHMSDVVSLQKSKAYVATLNREVAAYPVQKAYQEARADYDAVVGDKSASPQAKLNAWQEYSGTLTKLSEDPRIQTDDNIRSRLIAEVKGQDGVPNLSESFTGLAEGQYDPSSAVDNKKNADNIAFMQEQVDAVAGGSALWTYGERDSNGVFVPKSGGRMVGAATPEAVQAGGSNPQLITIPDPRGGAPLQMAVTATPIYATAKDPATGDPLPGTNSTPIGYAYDIPSGAGTNTQYSFTTKDGPIFTSNPLWDDNAKVSNSGKGGNHIEVDFSDMVARDLGYADKDPLTGRYNTVPADINTDRDLPGGIHVRASVDFDPKTGLPKAPSIAFDPQTLAWNSGTRGQIGAPDPITDFKSLTLSTLMDDPEGRSVLNNLDKNPLFRATIEGDAYQSAGYQQDPKLGWVPGPNADPTKLATALGQQTLATQTKSLSAFVDESAKLFQRMVTGSPAGKADATGPDRPVAPLATDLVQNTPFAAMSAVFHPGTSTMKPPDATLSTNTTIKPVGTIKAPALPAGYLPPATTQSGYVPPSTGQQAPPPPQTGSYAPPPATGSQSGSAPPKPTQPSTKPPSGYHPI